MNIETAALWVFGLIKTRSRFGADMTVAIYRAALAEYERKQRREPVTCWCDDCRPFGQQRDITLN